MQILEKRLNELKESKNESETERLSTLQEAIRTIIKEIGDDPSREGLAETPARVIKSWEELFKGYKQNPKEILVKRFKNESKDSGMVILKDIEFYSTCEHHMIPFTGKAHIAYFPRDEIVGLSKLARLVDCFARRLQVQEHMTNQIADALEAELNPLGVAVVMEAKHFCMCSRGVNKQSSTMITSAMRGHFLKAEPRSEFLALIK